MFERFLERLSKLDYRDKFIIKGGMLVAALVGLDTRSTMDLDTTIRNFSLTEDKVKEAIETICMVHLDDEVTFEFVSIALIRKDDNYGGFCVRLNAVYDTIVTPLSIDITTGDVITPAAVQYDFTGVFDNGFHIRLWCYNIETVMAEKVETILRRNVFSTRPRDYYDVYILAETQKYDKSLFKEALQASAVHRDSANIISDTNKIISLLYQSDEQKNTWNKYRKKFSYAKDITYEQILEQLEKLLQ